MTETMSAEEFNAMMSGRGGKSKYGNAKTEVDGITFDSRAEADRYVDLKRMQDAGLIEELKLQLQLPVFINGVKVFVYYADFAYYDREKGETIYEDVKGMRTDVYRLKKKSVEAFYRITITEVRR